MRQDELMVGQVYAFGGVMPSSAGPWVNPKAHGTAGLYVQAITLAKPSRGGVLALIASYHEKSVGAERIGQASLREAKKYKASHWAKVEAAMDAAQGSALGSDEHKAAIEALRTERAKVPRGWRVCTIRTQQIRFTWADYAIEHQLRIAEAAAEREEADAKYARAKAVQNSLMSRGRDMGFDTTPVGGVGSLRIKVEDFELLLDGFQKP